MKKIFYTFLLISPLVFIYSCEEEETQSGYNCISNSCSAVFENPQYLTLSDCQSVCADNNGVNNIDLINSIWDATYPQDFQGYSIADYNIHEDLQAWRITFDEENLDMFVIDDNGIEHTDTAPYYLINNELYVDALSNAGYEIVLNGDMITISIESKSANFYRQE